MFFSKSIANRFRVHRKFPALPAKMRVFAVGIPTGLQDAIKPLLREHNANVTYIDSPMELLHEPRMADVLLVHPIEMGANRPLKKRLEKIRIQLRYEAEGNNDALHVMMLAIQVSTNPGSYAMLKDRVDRFDAKHNAKLSGEQAKQLVSAVASSNEVLNSDIAAAMAAKARADSKPAAEAVLEIGHAEASKEVE